MRDRHSIWSSVNFRLRAFSNRVWPTRQAERIAIGLSLMLALLATLTLRNHQQTASAQSGGTSVVQLAVDDGTYETNIGITASGTHTAYYVNRLPPGSYPATLSTVAIFFDSDSGVKVGDPITLFVGVNTKSEHKRLGQH